MAQAGWRQAGGQAGRQAGKGSGEDQRQARYWWGKWGVGMAQWQAHKCSSSGGGGGRTCRQQPPGAAAAVNG